MDSKTKKLLQIFLTLTLLQTISACSEEEDGGSSGASSGNPTSPIDTTPVGTVEATGFWVNVRSTLFPSYANTTAGWDNPCFISATETTPQRMECIVDMLEGDLYMYSVGLQFNAPPNLCTHVTVSPSWHWNFSPGKGPKRIELEQNVTACMSTLEDDSVVACNLNPEVYISDNKPLCIYDHSMGGQVQAPNCCFGSYDLIVETDTDDDGTPDETVSFFGQEWNDPEGVKECLGGSVLSTSNWDIFTKSGYPASKIYGVGLPGDDNLGLNDQITLQANAQDLRTNFTYQANFYTETGNPHNHSGYVSATTSNLPYAFTPIDDLDGSPFDTFSRGVSLRSGSPTYKFACLDGAFEVLHEIHVYIREWNTLAAFMAYEESEGLVYDPDVSGSEGGDCDYDPIFGDSCNDQFDLDDILDSVGGSYDTSDPDDALLRSLYFPRVLK